MIQPDQSNHNNGALPSASDMILKWAQERPNEIYLKQIIDRPFVEYSYFDVADQAL